MGRHAPPRRRAPRHLLAAVACATALTLGATAALAATGDLNFSDVAADGGVYRTTVEDGKLKSLEFIPDGTAPSASADNSPAAVPPLTMPSTSPTASERASGGQSSAAPAASPTGKPDPGDKTAVPPAPSATPDPAADPGTPVDVVADGNWLSGMSGGDEGDFGAWRGGDVEIVGTWADADVANQTEVYTVTGGAGQFAGPIDIGVGALVEGETWAQAAAGELDGRWRESLQTMADARAGKGTTYIRFAHEMNGNWYPWAVDADSREDFITGWKRYRALQTEIFPAAQLVFSVNRESVGSGFAWTDSFPGSDYVDVMSVDYYNRYPVVGEGEETWASTLDDVDGYGAPKGLEEHRAFAASVGLPLAVSEWSGAGAFGDNPEFIDGMADFFEANGGDGAGQMLYEVVFNIDGYSDDFQLFPTDTQPQTAARYQERF